MEKSPTSDIVEGLKLIEERWGQLRLSGEEHISIEMGKEEVSKMDKIKERRSLVGKICSD